MRKSNQIFNTIFSVLITILTLAIGVVLLEDNDFLTFWTMLSLNALLVATLTLDSIFTTYTGE